jgi:hypothetical protein
MAKEITKEYPGITLEKIYEIMAKIIAKSDKNIQSELDKIESDKDGLSQSQLLSIQSKIQSWQNMSATASGMLRAVGDALKATVQNIR